MLILDLFMLVKFGRSGKETRRIETFQVKELIFKKIKIIGEGVSVVKKC